MMHFGPGVEPMIPKCQTCNKQKAGVMIRVFCSHYWLWMDMGRHGLFIHAYVRSTERLGGHPKMLRGESFDGRRQSDPTFLTAKDKEVRYGSAGKPLLSIASRSENKYLGFSIKNSGSNFAGFMLKCWLKISTLRHFIRT